MKSLRHLVEALRQHVRVEGVSFSHDEQEASIHYLTKHGVLEGFVTIKDVGGLSSEVRYREELSRILNDLEMLGYGGTEG